MEPVERTNKSLSSILERITDGFQFLDRKWRFTYINKRGAEILDMKAEDLLGTVIWNRFPYAKKNNFYKEYHNAMETMKPSHFDEYYPEPLNKWLEMHCYPSEEGLAVHFRDVTERKELEEASHLLNIRFEMAQRAARVGVWDWDMKTDHLEWTPEMFNLFGLDPQKTTASFDSWNVILHPEDKEKASLKIDGALKDHASLDSEYRIIRPDGRTIWINALGQAEYDDQNRPTRMTGICIDITRRKKAEQAIEKERTRLQLILDSLPVAVALADETGSLQIVNKMTQELWAGATENINQVSEYIGYQPGTEVQLKSEDWPIIRALKQGATILNEEIDVKRLDGTRGTVLASAIPMKDENGKINGALVAYMDITELKELERNLARSNVDLQQFAYIASHDLQEPLRMVTNYLSLLDRRYHDKLDAKAQEYIDFALAGGVRMRQLINDLLEYSRVDAVSKVFTPVDMKDVVSKSLAILEESIKETDAEITIEPLPMILADESQMAQLMQNLISNAIKFHGPERPKIVISAFEGVRVVTFAIKDNGIGMNMQHADKIFQMFQRLHGRDEYPGTGVGLAIAKKIVDHHGGRIWAESEERKGATFFFTIPIQAVLKEQDTANLVVS